MSALGLQVLFIALGAVIGAVSGWFLRGGSLPRVVEEHATPTVVASPVAAPSEPAQSFDHVEAVMSRLHQLTASVAADVGEHTSRVQAINDELSSGGDVVSVVERLMKVNEQMQSQLQAAEQRMQQQAQEIESHVKDARTDALTKLANRRAFDDEIRRCIDLFRTKGQPSCVMMIDVDHFKKFNDTYGHQAGDEVLRSVGRVLRREASGKEVVCRYGGEEFAVIYPGMDITVTIPRAEKARAAIAREIVEFQGMDLKVTASGGVAQLTQAESGEALVKRADVALYVCKENGRNCGYWHDTKTSKPMKDFGVEELKPAPPALAVEPEPTSVEPEVPEAGSVFQLAPDRAAPKVHRRDRLAGVSSFESFCEDLDRRIAEHQRQGTASSLLLITVDGCEDIANTYGGKAVELTLRATTQIIKATMRDMDHLARYNDVSLALMLPGASLMEASSIAERIRSAVEACPVPVHGDSLYFTVSLGAAEFLKQDEREQLLDRASQSLSAARDAGGNRLLTITESGDIRSVKLS